MDTLASYLPQDRRQALARGEELPERASGTVLFADISGFTPLTERLAALLGARPGAEALAALLDRVYTALVGAVEARRGSVISFAGDAITCWFDEADGPAPPRAAAAALAMQRAMGAFAAVPLPDGGAAPLRLKVALASGPARRLGVGDPAIQLLDVLAGDTVARVAQIEQLTGPGEALVDQATAAALGAAAALGPWRASAEDAALRAAPLAGLEPAPAPNPWPPLPDGALGLDRLRPWLLGAVAEREAAGLGAIVMAFRPVVALFLRFTGIDYEADDAGARLDGFVGAVQRILERHGGTLLQLTVGDKGSYIYAGFGALVAHEDDARRAVLAALALRAQLAEGGGLAPLQIGVSRGMLRTGAYGAPTRRTYGALGDDVNLAARLMALAAPGETLISGRVQHVLGPQLALEPRVPIRLKGKAEPLPVFAVLGLSRRRPIRLEEPAYTLPMVGRDAERATLAEAMARALAGQGQVLGIIAEAGVGKSRLVAEAIRMARQRRLVGYGGACASYGTRTPYLAWEPILRACFDLDPEAPARRQLRLLESLVAAWAPERAEALPLLGALLGLSPPESDLTRALEPQYRKSALHALLVDCLRAVAQEAAAEGGGLMLVIEDLHWIDDLSHDLLEDVARAIADQPALIVLAYRPPELLRLRAPRVEALPHFTTIRLDALGADDSEQLIRAKLAQLFPERAGGAPPELVARVTATAQGNPFYVEELLNYLRDRGLDPRDGAALAATELPASLHSLVLSRLDQLPSRQQAALQFASVIGRRFRHGWLHGAYPALGSPDPLKADLEALARLELTPLDTPEPELAYLFKHIVTQEVAYGTLAEAARAALHEQLATYLERLAGDAPDGLVDLLAYHYERSANLPKTRHYLRRAGELAAGRFANHAAVEYLTRALELAPADDLEERYALLSAREKVFSLQSERQLQAQDLAALEGLAARAGERRWLAEALLRRAAYAAQSGDHAAADAAADRALAEAAALEDQALASRAHRLRGVGAARQADYQAAAAWFERSVAAARASGDEQLTIAALSNLGIVAWYQGAYDQARAYYEEALARARQMGARVSESYSLGNLGLVAANQGDYEAARDFHEQSLRISRAVGDRAAEGRTLNNLGEVTWSQGDLAAALGYLERSLAIARSSESRPSEALTLANLAHVLAALERDAESLAALEQSLALAREVRHRSAEGIALEVLGAIRLRQGLLDEAAAALGQAIALHADLGTPHRLPGPQSALALVALARGDVAAAVAQVGALLAPGGGEPGAQIDDLDVLERCYRVLGAAGDPRAPQVLARAHALLHERAGRFADEARRRRFLEGLPAHRAILRHWGQRP